MHAPFVPFPVRVAHHAHLMPDAIALIFNEECTSYRELEQQSTVLAMQLRARGLGSQSLVGLCMQRSPALIVALLAVFKAGCAYVPLDPHYPPARLEWMIGDSELALLLVDTYTQPQAALHDTPTMLIACDQLTDAAPGFDQALPPIMPNDLAYVIYTSGTTGTPKGVMIEHASLALLAEYLSQELALGNGARVLQFASLSFDASIWEIAMALGSGATLVLAEQATLADPLLLHALMRRQAIGLATLPPSLLALLPNDDLDSLHTLITAGEACHEAIARRWAPGRTFINAYGPTESTVCATLTRWSAEEHEPPTIGLALPYVQTYILNEDGLPVGEQQTGQLFLAGPALARGYLKRPQLTAARFPQSRFAPVQRLYATGDRVRQRADGKLEFLGRIDEQVKIAGHRIEPGEIEALLSQHPAVQLSALVPTGSAAAPQLVACVVAQPNTALDTAALRHWLAEQLPTWMLPARIVPMLALPQTPNGKIDRRALQQSLEHADVSAADRSAWSALEQTLAPLWEGILGTPAFERDDSFFALGGDSLRAMQLVLATQAQCGATPPLQALFANATLRAWSTLTAQALADRSPEPTPELAYAADQPIPLLAGQQQLALLDSLAFPLPLYHETLALRLPGTLQVEQLAAALAALEQRHPLLRATILAEEGLLRIHDGRRSALQTLDLSGFPKEQHAQLAEEQARELASQPFQLANGPLYRALLIRFDPAYQRLYLVFHHIIIDGLSLGLLLGDLAAFCQGVATAGPVTSAGDWARLAAAERAWQQSTHADQQRDYWRQQLADAPPMELPFARSTPQASGWLGGRVRTRLDATLLVAVDTCARSHEVTRFTLLASAFAALLARYTAQTDLLIGTVASTRSAATAQAVGYLLNSLALRVRLDAESMPFRELLAEVRRTLVEALAHKELPFGEVAGLLRASGTAHGQDPLRVMITLEPALPKLPEGWEAQLMTPDLGVSKFDLALVFEEQGGELQLTVQFNRERLDDLLVAQLPGHFMQLLQAALAQPEASIWSLPLLSASEQQALLGPAQLPATPTALLAQIQQQVREHPEAIAVSDGQQQLTYGALEAQAVQLALRLRAWGVGPDSAVAVCLQPGPSFVLACYAVLRAGAAYVPLDPSLPDARLRWMLDDCGALALLAEQATHSRLASTLPCLLLDDADWQPDQPAQQALDSLPAPQSLAYIIYTSGSTGHPKGVAIPHAGLNSLVAWHVDAFQLGRHDRTTQIAGLGFDASVWEIWPTLAAGATLYICDRTTRLAPEALQHWLIAQQITVSFVPTPLAERLLDLPWPQHGDLRIMLTGGDLLRRFAPASLPFQLINNYGPTESTVVATSGSVPSRAADGQALPSIGQALPGVYAYVLDRNRQLVARGVPGALYLGGRQLARGYLGRPDLTAAAFSPNPFHAGERMYATGDMVRWRSDGSLEFMGRSDDQVKIRGQRIELGEVEATLLRCVPLKEAVVLLSTNARGEASLSAYCVPALAKLDAEAIRSAVASQLPAALVPQQIVLLEQLPLTANGKIDRAALRVLGQAQAPAARAQRTSATQDALAQVWATLLALPEAAIGADSDFFAVGGSSLLVTQLVAAVHAAFAVDLGLTTVFTDSTLAEMAQAIDQLRLDPSAYSTALDLEAECLLDSAIQGPLQPLARGNSFQQVLLTGATGFLGAFLLKTLLETSTATVTCLVRAASTAQAQQRVAQALATYAGVTSPRLERVIALPSDLEAEGLGLSDACWQELTTSIDTIIHCAASVSFILPYARLKAGNVGGTSEVLRFSAEGGGIPLHYVSTGGVFGVGHLASGATLLREDDSIAHCAPHLHMGYLQSKWVAEQLVWQAQARGLPVAVYRPGIVMGSAATGVCNPTDYLPRLIQGCLELGVYPEVAEIKSIIPVDYAAQALLHIARQPEAFGRAYHLVNPHSPITVQELFAQLRQLGCELRGVAREEWIAALLAPEASTNPLRPLAFLFVVPVAQGRTLFDLFEHMPPFADQQTRAALADSGIDCAPINEVLLGSWLRWGSEHGLWSVVV